MIDREGAVCPPIVPREAEATPPKAYVFFTGKKCFLTKTREGLLSRQSNICSLQKFNSKNKQTGMPKRGN